MNRQRFLVALLVVVAVTMLPLYFFDRANMAVRKEKEELQQQIALVRDKATAVRNLESQIDEARQAGVALEQRLISANPFADMERELRATAGRADMQVTQLTLGGATEVKEVGLYKYSATVDLTGTVDGYVEFLRLLEQHPLLVEIPDLKLVFPVGTTTTYHTSLTVHFFGKEPPR